MMNGIGIGNGLMVYHHHHHHHYYYYGSPIRSNAPTKILLPSGVVDPVLKVPATDKVFSL